MGLTRLFGGATGITNQPQGLDIGLSGSNIKSIQRGIQSVSALSTGITISNIDPSKSIAFITYTGGNGTQIQDQTLGVAITNATTLTITKGTVSSTHDLEWCVIEFNNVKSKQTGSSAVANVNATNSITVSSVNTSKSLLYCTFTTTDTSTAMNRKNIRFDLESSTSIRTWGNNTMAITVLYQLIEFN